MNEEAAKGLAAVRRIVVHAGLAHMDDIMSCAMAFAFGVPHDAAVERRNPLPSEMDDTATLVMDVGGVHDPARLDFDHHQRLRTDPPKCAFKLLCEWLDVDDEMSMLFPWYDTWNLMDVHGPAAAAAAIGVSADAIDGFLSNPLADWTIRRFADDRAFRQKLLRTLGNSLALTRRCWLSMQPKISVRDVRGFKVADMTECLTEEVSHCSNAWIRLNRPALILSNDSRGPGVTVLRCSDDPRLDFARCAGKDYAFFAHPGGFVLKTASRDVDLERIIGDARVEGA